MNRISNLVLWGSVVLFLSFVADGQSWGQGPNYPPRDDPYYRDGTNGRYNDDRYSRQRRDNPSDRYMYEDGNDHRRDHNSLIGRVLTNLDNAAANAWLDGHERKHFEKAAKSLQAFEYRRAQGKFDRGKLDEAIQSLEHLANADRISDRDRDLLARDIQNLRQFRTSGGRYTNEGYGRFRDDRYNQNERYDGNWRSR